MSGKPEIFISCGQVTPTEVQLGSDISNLVTELTGAIPYFAQQEQTLEGLSLNILGAIYRASGFICVMHARGMVTGLQGVEHVRASVWIEQEIAIAAFLKQVLKRDIKIAAFVHHSVKREGIRELLQLNPKLFETEAEILGELRSTIPKWGLAGQGAPIQPKIRFSPTGIFEDGNGRKIHKMYAHLNLKNVTTKSINNFVVDLWVPKAFLNLSTIYAFDRQDRETGTHKSFRFTGKDYRVSFLLPGDDVDSFGIELHVPEEVLENKTLLEQVPIKLRVFADEGQPQDFAFLISLT